MTNRLLALTGALVLTVSLCPADTVSSITNDGVVIGTLDSRVDLFGDETGAFLLLPQFRSLMSDADGTEFRFFQVIYYTDEPVTWQGNIITPAGAPAHSGTVVDDPSGGWDYEQPGGDDTSPFYDSDTENNPNTGLPYAYPTLSYPDLHSADGVNPGISYTEDAPNNIDPNDQTLFETFLVFFDPTLAAEDTFDVLGGYSWGVYTNSMDQNLGISPTTLSISPSTIAELNGALDRSGYSGWTSQYVSNIEGAAPVPEPVSSWLLCAVVLAIGALRRNRPRTC